jgi:uncharacterized protein (TIGR04255 family)
VYLLVTDMVSVEPDREIYPNAPLRLVAAEARFPLSPRLATVEAGVAIEELGDVLPIPEEGQPVMQFMVGPADAEPSVPTPVMGGRILRLLSKDRTKAATLTGTNVVVETTRYERFEAFASLVERVMTLVDKFGPPVGIERVGLRYIDEIQVPNITESPGDWSPYVDGALLAAPNLLAQALVNTPLRTEAIQGLIQFGGPSERGVRIRYGAGIGTVVNPNGILHFQGASTDPSFIIDIDSYWMPSEVADFSRPQLMEVFEDLHGPLRGIFERSVTDRLRNDVLRVPREG